MKTLEEISAMPVDLDAAKALAEWHEWHEANSPEFVKLCFGPLGQYLDEMPESDVSELNAFIATMPKNPVPIPHGHRIATYDAETDTLIELEPLRPEIRETLLRNIAERKKKEADRVEG